MGIRLSAFPLDVDSPLHAFEFWALWWGWLESWHGERKKVVSFKREKNAQMNIFTPHTTRVMPKQQNNPTYNKCTSQTTRTSSTTWKWWERAWGPWTRPSCGEPSCASTTPREILCVSFSLLVCVSFYVIVCLLMCWYLCVAVSIVLLSMYYVLSMCCLLSNVLSNVLSVLGSDCAPSRGRAAETLAMLSRDIPWGI